MKHNHLISVIVPIYNVQEYLEGCVNSIISQTYKNLEIILVNDGSTDNSGTICEELAKGDERIVVIHQENGGLSDARNTGIQVAKGDYVFYLDSDDYITLDCLENLYEALVKYDAEIAQANFYYDYPDHLLYDNTLKGKDRVFTREEAMELLVQQNIIKNFAWGKLIRADIAKKHLFPKGKYFEDTFWKFYIIYDCKKYVALAKPMLYYLQRSASISGSFSMRNLHQLEGEGIRMDFLYEYYPRLMPLAKKALKNKLQQHRNHLAHLSEENQAIYLQVIQEHEDKYDIQSQPTLDKAKNLYARISKKVLNKNQYVKIDK